VRNRWRVFKSDEERTAPGKTFLPVVQEQRASERGSRRGGADFGKWRPRAPLEDGLPSAHGRMSTARHNRTARCARLSTRGYRRFEEDVLGIGTIGSAVARRCLLEENQ